MEVALLRHGSFLVNERRELLTMNSLAPTESEMPFQICSVEAIPARLIESWSNTSTWRICDGGLSQVS
jgi:hypothetical protein